MYRLEGRKVCRHRRRIIFVDIYPPEADRALCCAAIQRMSISVMVSCCKPGSARQANIWHSKIPSPIISDIYTSSELEKSQSSNNI